MAIIRHRQPDIDFLGKNFSDLMDEFFNDAVASRRDSFVPSIDVSETEKEYEVEVHLPGMKKEDISVDLEDGRLTISGERKFENEQKNKTFHRVETQYGSFTRTFQLPDNIDQDSVKAVYENGILNIRIDKSKEKAKKRISIK